jgi:hypothetical protein
MPRYIPYHPPKPLAQAHHYHPTSSDCSDQPDYSVNIHDQREDNHLGWEAHGLIPAFTKHRDGLLDESNICLFYHGPLVAEIFAASEDERRRSDSLSDLGVGFQLDPELAKLEQAEEVDKERPKTPTLVQEVETINTKGRRMPLTTVRPLSTSPAADIGSALARHNTAGDNDSSSSPTSSTSAISRSLDPSISPPPQPTAPTFFIPKPIQLSVFRRSLDPRLSQKDRSILSMPSWEEIDRRADVKQVNQRERWRIRATAHQHSKFTRRDSMQDSKQGCTKWKKRIHSVASNDAETDSEGPTSRSKCTKRQRTIATSDSSGLTSLSSRSPSPSPMPEKRDCLHFRDSESLTPLPDSPCPSPFIRA